MSQRQLRELARHIEQALTVGPPRERLRSVLRAVVGFHLDEERHWVAELACGHGQHVRHRPPWELREWVTTQAGRASRLGAELECKRCGSIREYAPRDRHGCLAVLRSHVDYSHPEAEKAFDAFLLRLPGPFFVVEDDAGVIWACGGIAMDPEQAGAGALHWSMVAASRQGRGLGRAITLRCLSAAPDGIERVVVCASPKVQGFYEKLGFIPQVPPGPRRDCVRLERLVRAAEV